MTLQFRLDSVESIELGVGLSRYDEREIARVPETPEVSDILREMVDTTWSDMVKYTNRHEGSPRQYELSEKYGGTEYVYLSSQDPMTIALTGIHKAVNLVVVNLLDVIDDIFCYFVRLVDVKGAKLTAIRRNIHFTGLVKKKVLKISSDTLTLSDQKLFKLDRDFDILIDSESVHIWRPNAFRLLADLSPAILEAARGHLSDIQEEMPFMDLSPNR